MHFGLSVITKILAVANNNNNNSIIINSNARFIVLNGKLIESSLYK